MTSGVDFAARSRWQRGRTCAAAGIWEAPEPWTTFLQSVREMPRLGSGSQEGSRRFRRERILLFQEDFERPDRAMISPRIFPILALLSSFEIASHDTRNEANAKRFPRSLFLSTNLVTQFSQEKELTLPLSRGANLDRFRLRKSPGTLR